MSKLHGKKISLGWALAVLVAFASGWALSLLRPVKIDLGDSIGVEVQIDWPVEQPDVDMGESLTVSNVVPMDEFGVLVVQCEVGEPDTDRPQCWFTRHDFPDNIRAESPWFETREILVFEDQLTVVHCRGVRSGDRKLESGISTYGFDANCAWDEIGGDEKGEGGNSTAPTNAIRFTTNPYGAP